MRVVYFISSLFLAQFWLTVGEVWGNSIEEDVYGRQLSGRYGWQYGYHIQLDEEKLMVSVGLHLVAAPGVSRVLMDQAWLEWESEIERVWSNRFAVVSGDKSYPIVIDATVQGTGFKHDVIVLPGGGRRSNELTWHIMDTPQTVAHEFGHMLGLFDEYRGGATDPDGMVYNRDSIMTSRPVSGKTYPRHYERFRQWVVDNTGWSDVQLQPVIITSTDKSVTGNVLAHQ